jgi:hypothetical protein
MVNFLGATRLKEGIPMASILPQIGVSVKQKLGTRNNRMCADSWRRFSAKKRIK